MKGISGKLLLLVFFLAIGLLVFSSGQASAMFPTSVPEGVVPCATDANDAPCTLCHFIIGFYNLFKYGLYIVITVAFIAVFFAGTMYVISTGDEGMMTAAKSFLKAALIGFTVVAGAWLIVNITLWAISAKKATDPGGGLGVGRTNWYTFTCDTTSSALTPVSTTTSSSTTTTTTSQAGVAGTSCGAGGAGTCAAVTGFYILPSSACASVGKVPVSGGGSCQVNVYCCGPGTVNTTPDVTP